MNRLALVVLCLLLGLTLNSNPLFATESSPSVIFFMPIGAADNPFVLMSEKGILAASQLHPEVQVARVYPFSTDQIHHYMAFTAGRGHSYIVGIGEYYADAFAKVCDQFPNTRFVIIDGSLPARNVKSITFTDEEGGILAGAVAAAASRSLHVGFLGAMEANPSIRAFARGFRTGVQKINPRVRVSEGYIGRDARSFSDRQGGYDGALRLYSAGCDVVFPAAGAAAIGSIDAARDKRKFVIGVDGDLDSRGVGYVLTSVMKRLDTAVLNLVGEIAQGKFNNDALEYHTGNGGFTLTSFPYTANLLGREKLARIHDVLFELKSRHENSLTRRVRADYSSPQRSDHQSRIEDLRRRLLDYQKKSRR